MVQGGLATRFVTARARIAAAGLNWAISISCHRQFMCAWVAWTSWQKIACWVGDAFCCKLPLALFWGFDLANQAPKTKSRVENRRRWSLPGQGSVKQGQATRCIGNESGAIWFLNLSNAGFFFLWGYEEYFLCADYNLETFCLQIFSSCCLQKAFWFVKICLIHLQ